MAVLRESVRLLIFKIFLFDWPSLRDGGTEGERSCTHYFILQMTTMSSLCQAKARSVVSHNGQDTKLLGHLPLVFPSDEQQARSQVEQLGPKWLPIWDEGHGSTHCATEQV